MAGLPSVTDIAASAGISLPPVFTDGIPGVQLPPSIPRQMDPLWYEKVLALMGLGHPLTRAVAGFVAAGATLYLIKPDWAFDRRGNPRPWAPLLIGHAARDATNIPWWMVCTASAISAAIFL